MAQSAKFREYAQAGPPPQAATDGHTGVRPLAGTERDEALAFFATGSVNCIYMSSLIYDNGVQSPLNRGTFCAYRGAGGTLEGVALVGHATVVEARTEAALEAFAAVAKRCQTAHVIAGQEELVERFWRHYQEGGQEPLRVCRELLFEQRRPAPGHADGPRLRRATPDDLASVLEVNARMAIDESGVDPRATDPEGFRFRALRRIEQGRVWVWAEDGRLVFKAEVMAETPEFRYLEGVHVHPDERRRGIGLRCMRQLGRTLLADSRALSLLVNEQNEEAQAFFFKAGYELRGCYDTIYLKRY